MRQLVRKFIRKSWENVVRRKEDTLKAFSRDMKRVIRPEDTLFEKSVCAASAAAGFGIYVGTFPLWTFIEVLQDLEDQQSNK